VYDDILVSIQNKTDKLNRQFEKSIDPKVQIAGQRYKKDVALGQLARA